MRRRRSHPTWTLRLRTRRVIANTAHLPSYGGSIRTLGRFYGPVWAEVWLWHGVLVLTPPLRSRNRTVLLLLCGSIGYAVYEAGRDDEENIRAVCIDVDE